ncbi:MAG: 50S ribosomal protein L23 [Microgenomates group bacterium]
MKLNEIILAPILTEKTTKLAKNKVYVFKVNRLANKFQIKEVLEKLYPVKVGKVRIQVQKGQRKKVGKRRVIKKLPKEKIAYVSLVKGKIDFFPQS